MNGGRYFKKGRKKKQHREGIMRRGENCCLWMEYLAQKYNNIIYMRNWKKTPTEKETWD